MHQKNKRARGTRLPGFRWQKPGSVSRRRGFTEPAKAPVESEQHALDVDIHVVAIPEVDIVAESSQWKLPSLLKLSRSVKR